MKYESLRPIGKVEAEEMFLSGDPAKISEGLVRAVNSLNDWKWLQDKCLHFAFDSDFWVAKNSIVCLGDIARIFGVLEVDLVLSQLRKLGQDPKLRGYVEDTVDDIEVYIGTD